MKHDTAEIRRIARVVKQNAAAIHELESGTLQPLTRAVPQALRGQAADALLTEITELATAMRRLGIDINGIGDELNSFARRLDIADQQAADRIRSH